MDERIVERKEAGDYRITIWHDWDAESPCVNWDMAARYLFEYNDCGRCLYSECNWRDVWGERGENRHSLNESLCILIEENCDFDLLWNYIKNGKLESVRLNYDRSSQVWNLSVSCCLGWGKEPRWDVISEIYAYERKGKYWNVFEDMFDILKTQDLVEILNACGKNIYAKEWGTIGYSQGDYIEGVAYCTKEWYDKRTGSNGTPWKKHIDMLIDEEVKEIGMWMWGDVIGYTLEKKVPFTNHFYEDPGREDEDDYEWEEVDSCWGYYMTPDELIAEVMAEHGIKEEDAA